MDPYIEWQAAWPDFHNGLIAEIRNELGARLPDEIASEEIGMQSADEEADPKKRYAGLGKPPA